MNLIQNILQKSLFFFSLLTLIFTAIPQISYAQSFTGGGGSSRGAGGGRSTIADSTSTTSWSGTCVSNGDVATIQGFECLFANILKVVMGAAGLTFFAMLVVGGFKFITSGGDPKKMASASSTLTLAFVSVLGVIVSWLILLLIQNFTGVNVTQFKIGS